MRDIGMPDETPFLLVQTDVADKQPTAWEVVRRLVARESVNGDPSTNPEEGRMAAAHRACESTNRALTRRLGVDGTRALFARALAQARTEHPVLAKIALASEKDTCLSGVQSVKNEGPDVVASGLEAMLAMLIGLLIGLIGPDLTRQLVERPANGTAEDDVGSGGPS